MAPSLLTASDLDIAARTLYGEARGESYEGKLAVAHVLLNRWRTNDGQFRKDDTLATTCLRHFQFSAWTKGDPNFIHMQTIGPGEKPYRECMRAVLEAMDSEDPTHGSRHYHTKAMGWPATWGERKTPVYESGRHQFYNDVK